MFGWMFSRLNATAYPQKIDGDFTLTVRHSYAASTGAVPDAHRFRLLKRDLDRQIGEALCEITSIDPSMEGGSEKFQPLEIQGAWQMDCFAGKGTRPLASAEFDIAAARKAKNLTQAQPADAMGAGQVMASHWESGKVSPNAGNLAKLKELLG